MEEAESMVYLMSNDSLVNRDERNAVTILTINLDDELARHVEESARREHKSISEWVGEKVKPGADRAAALAALEAQCLANGYPTNWLALYGSLAGDESFIAPPRTGCRPVSSLD